MKKTHFQWSEAWFSTRLGCLTLSVKFCEEQSQVFTDKLLRVANRPEARGQRWGAVKFLPIPPGMVEVVDVEEGAEEELVQALEEWAAIADRAVARAWAKQRKHAHEVRDREAAAKRMSERIRSVASS